VTKRAVNGDICIYKRGSGTFRAELIRRLGLLNKFVVFQSDEDDKENKFLYVTIDETGEEPAAKKLILQKSGSCQVSFTQIQKEFNSLNKSMGFDYMKKTTNNSKPLFVFKRREANPEKKGK
jgi:hypothetical protein